jgi:multicomponent K+:H+ antiporter subunit G
MSFFIELLIAALIVIGSSFALVGSFGLIKLPDLMTRLHAPTKATTLGVGAVLIASMLYYPFAVGEYSVHELVITLFLFLTAPITANFIAKAYLHLEQHADRLPPTGRPVGWATFDPPANQDGDEDPVHHNLPSSQ